MTPVKAKIIIEFDDDRRILYGIIHDTSPFILKIPGMKPGVMTLSRRTSVYWHESGGFFRAVLGFESGDEETGMLRFTVVEEKQKVTGSGHNRIDHKGNIFIKVLSTDAEVASHTMMAERHNAEVKNSMVARIRNIIQNEAREIQHILKFLMEMDNKLDEILSHVRADGPFDDLAMVRGIDIGGDGVSFFAENDIPAGTDLYLGVHIADASNKLRFAALARVVSSRKTDAGAVIDTEMYHLDEDLREEIIRYVFEKERDLLKGVTTS